MEQFRFSQELIGQYLWILWHQSQLVLSFHSYLNKLFLQASQWKLENLSSIVFTYKLFPFLPHIYEPASSILQCLISKNSFLIDNCPCSLLDPTTRCLVLLVLLTPIASSRDEDFPTLVFSTLPLPQIDVGCTPQNKVIYENFFF